MRDDRTSTADKRFLEFNAIDASNVDQELPFSFRQGSLLAAADEEVVASFA
jgi:hypothetical protein